MDYAYVNSAFFDSCIEEFAASLDEDDDAPMTEGDAGRAGQEPPVQQDAPAREDPPA